MIDLRPFQRRFVRAVESDRYDTLALTLPRGEGKSTLAGEIGAMTFDEDSSLFMGRDHEVVVLAASLEQGRIVFNATCDALGGKSELIKNKDWSIADSLTRIHLKYKPLNLTLRVIASKAKTAMGLVNVPLVIADEPGSWEVTGGRLMYDAIQKAQGKVGSHLKSIYIGTLAPAVSGWWITLTERGTHGSTYVQALRGDPEKWDSPYEIKRCNPIKWVDAKSRRKLFEEREDARFDTAEKAAFLSYRLNIPSGDELTMLVGAGAFLDAVARKAPPRSGVPMVGVDVGANRAWTAAVAIYPSGRIEAFAIAPGIPSLEEQEKRDRVPKSTYQKLYDQGYLLLGEKDGELVNFSPPEQLVEGILARWGEPYGVIADRFKDFLLGNALQGIPHEFRVARYSEASADIYATRKYMADGPFSFEAESIPLLVTSLEKAQVKNDDQGNTRMTKNKDNRARDDVAAALVLAAGACDRYRYFERVEEETEEIEVLSF